MIFDDVFYPGNPKKRAEIAETKAEVTVIFKNYKENWNKLVLALNAAFREVDDPQYRETQFITLSKDIEKDSVGDCVSEITNAANDAKDQLAKLVADAELDKFLPGDWQKSGIKLSELDEDVFLKIGRALSMTLSVGVSGFIGYYLFTGVTAMSAIIFAAGSVTTALAALIGGAMLSLVISGAGFVITDMISSAITGAIERKKLDEALTALKKLKDDVQPLENSANQLGALYVSFMKSQSYYLGDYLDLVLGPDGNWYVQRRAGSPTTSSGTGSKRKILSDPSQTFILFCSPRVH